MTEEEPEDETLMRVTWRLKRVLTKLGFSCEDLAREALAAITGKADWNVKFCLRYCHFLKNPAEHMKEFWCMMDESFFYKGEGTSKGIVLDGEAELNELGSFRRYGLGKADAEPL